MIQPPGVQLLSPPQRCRGRCPACGPVESPEHSQPEVSVRRHRSACRAGQVQRPDQIIISKHKQVQARAPRAMVLLRWQLASAVLNSMRTKPCSLRPCPVSSRTAKTGLANLFKVRYLLGESLLPSATGRGRCEVSPRLEGAAARAKAWPSRQAHGRGRAGSTLTGRACRRTWEPNLPLKVNQAPLDMPPVDWAER